MMTAFESSFNSLFEMPWRLFIFAKTVIGPFNSLFEMRLSASADRAQTPQSLSILYLRCPNYGAAPLALWRRPAFNSLFEMLASVWSDGRGYRRRLSILYLRCEHAELAERPHGAPSSYFQFSI